MVDKLPSLVDLTNEVIALAEKFPDVVYNPTGKGECLYGFDLSDTIKPEDCPTGCIIGAAAKNLGFDLEEAAENIKGSTNSSYPNISSLYKHIDGITLWQSRYGFFLGMVQADQDCGVSWGVAVARSKKSLDRWQVELATIPTLDYF